MMSEMYFLNHQMNDEEFKQWSLVASDVANQCKKMEIPESYIEQVIQRFSEDRFFEGIGKNISEDGEHYKLIRKEIN